MQPIIEKISNKHGVPFTMDESSFFDGQMHAPVKTYSLNYPTSLGILHLKGEYRRNSWQKPNWHKDIHHTDIYLWSIKTVLNSSVTEFKIETNSWLKMKFFKAPSLNIKCQNEQIKESLSNLPALNDLFTGSGPTVSATIKCDGKSISTNFNTQLEHELLIERALLAFHEIEKEIQ